MVEEESVSEISQVAHVVNGERDKHQFVLVERGGALFIDGEFAFCCFMVNGMSHLDGAVLIVQFSSRSLAHRAVVGGQWCGC